MKKFVIKRPKVYERVEYNRDTDRILSLITVKGAPVGCRVISLNSSGHHP